MAGVAGVGINSPPLLFDSYATFDLPPAVQDQPTSERMPMEFWGVFLVEKNNNTYEHWVTAAMVFNGSFGFIMLDPTLSHSLNSALATTSTSNNHCFR